MTKRLYILILTLILVLSVKAQNDSSAVSDTADTLTHSLLSSGKWVKIRVGYEGVYKITASALAGMGFTNPAKVSLYGNNQPVLPEEDIDNEDNDLQDIPLWRLSDGSLLFYSKGLVRWDKASTGYSHLRNPYSNYIYYFLTENDNPAKFTQKSISTPNHSTTTFPERKLMEFDEYSIENEGRTFFENYEYKNGLEKTYTLATPGISNGQLNAYVRFASTGSGTLKHVINSGTTTTTTFSGLSSNTYATVKTSKLSNTNSQGTSASLSLSYSSSSNASGYLDYISYWYDRKLDLTGLNYLAFRTPEDYNYSVSISGANANTKVWKVSSPSQTYELKGELQNGVYKVNVDNDGEDEFVAVNLNGTFAEPEVVGTIAFQDLRSVRDIHFLIIVPSSGSLLEQATRLAMAHEEADSITCLVVKADQIYNEFSSGTPDPTAVRRFLRMLKQTASSTENEPQNVLLFGDGVWDNRFVTKSNAGKLQEDYLLCYESDNSWSSVDSYVLEDYYGLIADNAGKKDSVLYDKPEVGVGRIPVTSSVDAKNIVTKLLTYIYNKQKGAWKNTICMMGDDGNANTHMNDAEKVTAVIKATNPNFRIKKIYWDAYERTVTTTGNGYPNVLEDINKTMTDGALIMNYTGHGSYYTLSHEMVIGKANFKSWSSPRLPLWVTAACDVTPFDKNVEDQGTAAITNAKGAAMGFIGTTRTVFSSHNQTLNRYLMRRLLELDTDGKQRTIGQALAMAKGDIIGNNRRTAGSTAVMNKAHYVLIGDPAIKLAFPTYKTVIDSIGSGAVAEDGKPLISAGSTVNVKGHIVDEDGNMADNFDGSVIPTVFDNEQIIRCKNNDESADTVFWYRDYTRTIFNGEYPVKGGEFSFNFPVPLDINYSNKPGRIDIYAKSSTHEAHGKYTDFYVGGTGELKKDTIGPKIKLWLNSDDFETGDEVNETPWLHIELSDESGINTTGNGLGHDIIAIIDNDNSQTYSLNSYFTQTIGDYTSGEVGFSVPTMSEGKHTMVVRAFDIYNNKSERTINFTVVPGLKPEILYMSMIGEVGESAKFIVVNNRRGTNIKVNFWIVDVTGRVLYSETRSDQENNDMYYTFEWDIPSSMGVIPPGVYIARVGISTQDGKEVKLAKKFAVRGNKQQ